jgi:hypothetical protein
MIKERAMANLRFILYFYIVMAFMAFGQGFVPQTITAAEAAVPVPEEDVQVLTSGPIHEAFAEAVAMDPEPGIVAPKAPPALIEEIPPEQRPEGDVQWIPGYWAWDDERNEYIWVSGIWRVPPPGRQWVPGYWTPVTRGNQWISGYWARLNAEETEYLPEPPKWLEVGPSSNAPSPNYTWVPGAWVWHYGRYTWRPGYWAVVHADWIWVPDHYIWTPRGYIFVGGYWDYAVIHRGVLFAPVYFPPRTSLGLTFSFSPGFVISLGVFDDALFLRPRYCHYYYGDYYAPKYYKRGIYPWFSLHARRVVYDPIYVHQRWNHRNDREWENRLQTRFRERREQERLQPPRSFDSRKGPGKGSKSSGPERLNFVTKLGRAEKAKASAYRFKPLREKEHREFSQREKEVRTYRQERQNREAQRQKMLQAKVSKKPEPNKQKVSRSPTTDTSKKKAVRKKAPPARYEMSEPNPNAEPLERKYDLSRSRGKSRNSETRGQTVEARRQPPSPRGFGAPRRSEVRGQKSDNREKLSEDRKQKSDSRPQRGEDGRQRWNER